jgi:hypothetical protein
VSAGEGRLETAAGARGWDTFPPDWGIPPGSQFSEERAAWVRSKVCEHQRWTPARVRAALAAKDHRLMWALRAIELESRRVGPS